MGIVCKEFLDRFTQSAAFQNAIALLMILIFAGLNFVSVQRGFSLTTDEDKHYLYGSNIVAGNSNRLDDSKMPVTALNAIPARIASFLDDGLAKRFLEKYYTARSVTILFSCLLAFLVFAWARQLYGFPPALFSLILFVWDPNIMAHSQLVANDLYVTAGTAFTFYTLWMFANKRTWRNGLLFGVALGVSQLTKYSAIALIPLVILALFIYDGRVWQDALHNFGKFKALVWQYLVYGVCMLLVVIVIINVGFLFNRTFTPFGEFPLRSDVFLRLSHEFPFLNAFPMPVPYPYLRGLDAMRNTEVTGDFSGNVYLLGRVNLQGGFPGYYFVAYFLKVPIASQIFILAGLVAYVLNKERRERFLRDEMFLLLPVAFFFVYFNFFLDTQIGIRYILPMFPLLYVFTANLFIPWKRFSPVKKAISLLLIVFLIISVLSYHPYYLSYFNEIVWDRKDAYKYLADSNLDWGQGKNELKQYLEEHRGALYSPKNVKSGRIVVRVNDLVGVTEDPARYAWLRDNFEPVDTIAYAYLVYKIDPEEIEQLCASTNYCDR